MKHYIESSGAVVLISTPDYIQKNGWVGKLLTTKTVHGKIADSILEDADDDSYTSEGLSLDDTLMAPFSSGTSGLPKCCLLTHRNFNASTAALKKGVFDQVLENSSKKTIAFLPFYHASGFWALIFCLMEGCTSYIMNKFHPLNMLDLIEEHKIDTINIVPAIARTLIQIGMKDRAPGLRTILCGSSALDEQTARQLLKLFPRVERLLQGYGMTELVVLSHITPYKDNFVHLGSCGKLLPGFEAQLINTDGEVITENNEKGELLLRSDAIMKSYKNETFAVDQEDWLHTGDIALKNEDGYYFIVDREKDLIKVNGFQVSPTEIEEVIQRNEKVKQAAVIGVHDEQTGEKPVAFLVLADDADPETTVAEVLTLVRDTLSPVKHLHGGIRIVEELPTSPSGKIQRYKLRN
ncbi:unnamed protein product [Caenorhabditis auriculariae]|uniref:AMP-dependent synthetase/ligase domain-containing protein n=1 Tax=Caenorhabditis auriculariae TaxID=2777116 RepID=A0A8S1GX34_9PELO|nr:unnamed protein product [Caenorhabditis auriculariae]